MSIPMPAMEIGRNVLARASADWRNAVVLTTPSPWAIAKGLANPPARLLTVAGMDLDTLDDLVRAAHGHEPVVGLGGGLAMDAAKYVAKASGAGLVQVPSTAANNACFTRTAWALKAGARTAVRDCPLPTRILVDADLVMAAPARLNRAGIAEILCSHTALFDWRLGYDAGRDVDWDDRLERRARDELAALDQLAPALGAGDEEAVLELFRAGARLAAGFTSHPKARFNAASEHLFGWALERQAGRRLVHGETVGLGILLMAHVQKNDPARAAMILGAAGVGFLPRDIGVTWPDVEKTFFELPRFARAFPWYTIVDELAPNRGEIARHFAAARSFVTGLT